MGRRTVHQMIVEQLALQLFVNDENRPTSRSWMYCKAETRKHYRELATGVTKYPGLLEEEEQLRKEKRDMLLSELELSTRALNVLQNQLGLVTVAQLESFSMQELDETPGCGVRTRHEIVATMNAMGFKLRRWT